MALGKLFNSHLYTTPTAALYASLPGFRIPAFPLAILLLRSPFPYLPHCIPLVCHLVPIGTAMYFST